MLCNVGVVFNAYYIILTYYNITRRLAISKVDLCPTLSVNGCGIGFYFSPCLVAVMLQRHGRGFLKAQAVCQA